MIKVSQDVDVTVISLIDSKLRKRIKKEFSDYNVDFVFYDAIYGKDNRHLFDEGAARERYNKDLLDGEVGCSLSHFNVLKYFISDSKSDWLLVLEDDVLLSNGFEPFLNMSSTSQTLSDASVLLLGHSKTRRSDLWLQRIKQPLTKVKNINNVIFGKNPRINYCGTVGYLINKSAAKKITQMGQASWVADDWKFLSSLGIEIYHPKTPVLYEDLHTTSSIGNRIFYNHSLFHRPVLQIGAAIKAQISRILGNI